VAEAIFNVRLGEDITLYWELDYASGNYSVNFNMPFYLVTNFIVFNYTGEFVAEIHAKNVDPSTTWVGIGFSSRGNIKLTIKELV